MPPTARGSSRAKHRLLSEGKTAVTFYYNHATHRVWAVSRQMVTLRVPSKKDWSCADSWKPECLAPLMEPVGGGTYLRDRVLPEGT